MDIKDNTDSDRIKYTEIAKIFKESWEKHSGSIDSINEELDSVNGTEFDKTTRTKGIIYTDEWIIHVEFSKKKPVRFMIEDRMYKFGHRDKMLTAEEYDKEMDLMNE